MCGIQRQANKLVEASRSVGESVPVNRLVVDSIPTRGDEIFIYIYIFISWEFVEGKAQR